MSFYLLRLLLYSYSYSFPKATNGVMIHFTVDYECVPYAVEIILFFLK